MPKICFVQPAGARLRSTLPPFSSKRPFSEMTAVSSSAVTPVDVTASLPDLTMRFESESSVSAPARDNTPASSPFSAICAPGPVIVPT